MSKLNVQLNANFRLTADDRNFIVLERRLVDPAKAPGYKAPADGSAPPPIRETYGNERYYPLSFDGLVAALNHVRIKSSTLAEAETLAELIAQMSAETDAILAAIDNTSELREFVAKLSA
jgi:hypothetical protein